MNAINNNSGLLLTVLLLVFTACHKDDDEPVDSEKPVLTVYEPTAGDTLSMSVEDSVHIQFYATDNDELHEVAVNITDINGTNVYSTLDDVDATAYSYHEHFFPGVVSSVVRYTILFQASDHSGNIASDTRIFYVKP